MPPEFWTPFSYSPRSRLGQPEAAWALFTSWRSTSWRSNVRFTSYCVLCWVRIYGAAMDSHWATAARAQSTLQNYFTEYEKSAGFNSKVTRNIITTSVSNHHFMSDYERSKVGQQYHPFNRFDSEIISRADLLQGCLVGSPTKISPIGGRQLGGHQPTICKSPQSLLCNCNIYAHGSFIRSNYPLPSTWHGSNLPYRICINSWFAGYPRAKLDLIFVPPDKSKLKELKKFKKEK